MKTFFKKLAWWLLYSVIVMIILAATLVSLTRMLTPYLNDHRHDFESWASEQLQAPIAIEQVHITWYYYQPVLTFENVVILDKDTHQPNLSIQQIKVNLQVLPSLLHWKPMPKYIKLFGTSLTLREATKGQIRVEGKSLLTVINTTKEDEAKPNGVVEWTLSQPRLVLDDIHIRYIPLQGAEKSVTLDRLSLVNTKSVHELSGNAILNQAIPLDVRFRVRVAGDIMDLTHLTAHGYFYLEGLSLPQWFKQNEWHNLKIIQGLGSAKIWVDWNQGAVQRINSELQMYDLQVKSLITQKIITVSRFNGKLGWKKEGNQQRIVGEDILIDFPTHLWPMTDFSMALVPAADGTLGIQTVRISYLDLADSIALLLSSGFVSDKPKQLLNQLDLKGQINSLDIEFAEPLTQLEKPTSLLNHSISFVFSDLSFQGFNQIPGMSHVSGLCQWSGQQGSVKLNSQKMIVNYNALFKAPLFFETAKGNFTISHDVSDNWALKMNNIEITNPDFSLNADINLTIFPNASPYIDLLAYFSMPNITSIKQYIPTKVMDPVLSHWLQNTFYGGKILNGKAIIKGNLNDFPFDNNTGQFNVSADINDLDFEYAPEWPGIKHLNGKLSFEGHKMTADVDTGHMLQIPLKNIHADIPYIGANQPQILNIQGSINTELKDALNYIKQTPLQKTIGKNLETVQLTGPVQLNLSLGIPLKNPEKTTVLGDMTIPNATLSVTDSNIKLEQLNGALHFTDNEIKATALKATLMGNPILLNVNSVPDEKGFPTVVVTYQSKISKMMLQEWFKLPPTPIFEGETTYSAQLNLASEQSLQPSQFIMTSDLNGVVVNLPGGFGKNASERRSFQMTINMNKRDKGIGIKVAYGNNLSAAIMLQKQQGTLKLYSGELHLGNAATANFQSKPGLLITGDFDQWDLQTWQGYLSSLSQTASLGKMKKNMSSALDFLRGIDINAKQLSLYNVNLHDARIEVRQEKKNVSVSVNSAEITGQIFIPSQMKGTIQAKLQHVYLSPVMSSQTVMDPKTWPAINFVGDDVRYNDIRFGSVTFNLVPTSSGLLIQSLRCHSAFYDLNAKGEWRSQSNSSKTNLQGNLTITDVGKLLNSWGIKGSNIVESNGSAQFNLNWTGPPYHPELNNVTGDIFLKLTSGRIVDLGNSTDAKMGIGKMLNIFNLSSLPRRLTLNFKDFENGYSFDSMQGHFTLKNGSIYTQDTRFDGSIARIEIGGRIGYVAKDYDVNYSVTPFGVTSSLPLVATVVGGPVVGAATWLVDKVVGGAVSNVITHHYTVRGPWSAPVWNEK